MTTPPGSKRSNRRVALLLAWIRINRPDVLKAVDSIIDEEFPRRKTTRMETLPYRLRDLK